MNKISLYLIVGFSFAFFNHSIIVASTQAANSSAARVMAKENAEEVLSEEDCLTLIAVRKEYEAETESYQSTIFIKPHRKFGRVALLAVLPQYTETENYYFMYLKKALVQNSECPQGQQQTTEVIASEETVTAFKKAVKAVHEHIKDKKFDNCSTTWLFHPVSKQLMWIEQRAIIQKAEAPKVAPTGVLLDILNSGK